MDICSCVRSHRQRYACVLHLELKTVRAADALSANRIIFQHTMKYYAITLSFLLLALNAIWATSEPRPLLASAMTLPNAIVVAIGNEDNSRVESVFILAGAQGLDMDFNIGRIQLSEHFLILWPLENMAEPLVLTLDNSAEYLKYLSAQEQTKANVFKGHDLSRTSKSTWTDGYGKMVDDLRQGKYNSELRIN